MVFAVDFEGIQIIRRPGIARIELGLLVDVGATENHRVFAHRMLEETVDRVIRVLIRFNAADTSRRDVGVDAINADFRIVFPEVIVIGEPPIRRQSLDGIGGSAAVRLIYGRVLGPIERGAQVPVVGDECVTANAGHILRQRAIDLGRRDGTGRDG